MALTAQDSIDIARPPLNLEKIVSNVPQLVICCLMVITISLWRLMSSIWAMTIYLPYST